MKIKMQRRWSVCASLTGWLLVLSLVAGCASERWRHPLAAGRPSPIQPSADSLAGKVQRVRQFAAAAHDLSQERLQENVSIYRQQLVDSRVGRPLKMEIVSALGVVGGDDALMGLVDAAADPDELVRTAACRELGRFGNAVAIDALAERVEVDASTDVRLVAIRSLAKSDSSVAHATLAETLDDRDPSIQVAAMQSLQRATGLDHGLDVAQWRRAVTTLR